MKKTITDLTFLHSLLLTGILSCAFLVPLQADSKTNQEERSVETKDDDFEEEEDFDEEVELPSFDQVKQFLAEKFPEAHAEIERIRSGEPINAYSEAMERVVEFYLEYQEMMERNEGSARAFLKLTQAEFKAEQLNEQYHESESGEERKAIVSEIRAQASIYFDSKTELYAQEIAAASEEIEEMQAELDEMRKNRYEWIDHHVAELLEEEDEEEGEGESDEDEDFDEEEDDCTPSFPVR